MKYVYGPVPSRRLGMSLGVDIIPFKTCTLDCIYCQLGSTTNKSIKRKAFVPKEDVLAEIKDVLDKESNRIDFITFSGSGEPTLNSEIGDMISEIKSFTKTPIAVLTNGTLLYLDDVRRDLSKADLVVPSLDFIAKSTFYKVNRPDERLEIEKILDGLKKFTEEFQGKIWLEIMIVKGINDDPKELKQLADFLRKLNVDKIHLNTVVRPPAEDTALPVTSEEMQNIAKLFDERVEIIADFNKIKTIYSQRENVSLEDRIISLLKRRPCTINDISNSLSIHINEAIKYTDHLLENGLIKRIKLGDKWYYEDSSCKEDR